MLILILIALTCESCSRTIIDDINEADQLKARGMHREAAIAYFSLGDAADRSPRERLWFDSGKWFYESSKEFIAAGDHHNAQIAAERATIRLSELLKIQSISETEKRLAARYLLRSKLLFAGSRMQTGDWEALRSLYEEQLQLSPTMLRLMNDCCLDFATGGSVGDEGWVTSSFRSHDPELAAKVSSHYEQFRQEKNARHANEQASIQEYERLHPEVVAERKAKEAATARRKQEEEAFRNAQQKAERQFEQCTSPCSNELLRCTTACIGNIKNFDRCNLSCTAANQSCTNRCEQQRDAQIVAAGGPAKEHSGDIFIGSLVAAADAFATAADTGKATTSGGVPSSSLSGQVNAASSSTSSVFVGSLAAAMDAFATSMESGKVHTSDGMPLSSTSSRPIAASGQNVAGRCDDSSEAREAEQLRQQAEVETKGMGIPQLQCYAARKFVRIAELQVRAARRCNIEISQSETELQRMRTQERSVCQGQ